MSASGEPTPVIVITDLNFPSDDFQALTLLLERTDVEIVQIIATDGNTWAEEVGQNVHAVLKAWNRLEIPLAVIPFAYRFKGRQRAYEAFRRDHKSFVGAYQKSHRPRVPALSIQIGGLTDFKDALNRRPGETVVLSLGPLSPIAALIDSFPRSSAAIARIIAMAGRLGQGRADFNVWFDPAAARRVFESAIEILLLPRNVCHAGRLDASVFRAIDRSTAAGRLLLSDMVGMIAQHGPDFPLIDAIIPLVMADGSLVRAARRGVVHVRRKPQRESGKTYFREDPNGNVLVIDKIDGNKLKASLLKQTAEFSRTGKRKSAAAADETFPLSLALEQRLNEKPFYKVTLCEDKPTPWENRRLLSSGETRRLYESILDFLTRARDAPPRLLAGYHPPPCCSRRDCAICPELSRTAHGAALLSTFMHLDVLASCSLNGRLVGFACMSLPSERRRLTLNKDQTRRVGEGDAVIEAAYVPPELSDGAISRRLMNALLGWWTNINENAPTRRLHVIESSCSSDFPTFSQVHFQQKNACHFTCDSQKPSSLSYRSYPNDKASRIGPS